jgi:diguanylate cyclase (GGDEF)-like protein
LAPVTSSSARRYCGAVALAGGVLLIGLALDSNADRFEQERTVAILLAGGVLLGELLPLKIPRRGEHEELTVSTSFAFALLLLAGLWPAVAAQSVASVVEDAISRKPLWRVVFNVGQYAISLAAASLVLTVAGVGGPGADPFTAGDLPAIAVAAAAFFIVNAVLVGIAVALYVGQPVGAYLRDDLGFSALTAAVLLSLSPIMVVALRAMPELYPLFIVLLLAVYVAGRQAARRHHEATHDRLTGLVNRQRFSERVDELIAGHEPRLALLLLDVNRFKDVNDALGHAYGDRLLRQVAERLATEVPSAREVGRLGGDEFAILLAPLSGDAAALAAASDVAESLRTPFEIEGVSLDGEASLGVVLYPQDGTDSDTLLRRGEVAMYRAKSRQADYARYSAEHDHHSPARLGLIGELRGAIESGQLVLHYQPKIDLQTGRVAGCEALVRWEHPELGLLRPSAFVPMAESTSLIRPLTRRVLEQALADAGVWRARGVELGVAVNLSARALNDPALPATVRDLLAEARMPPERLALELTESAIMADPSLTATVLDELHRMGVALSVDDFGTGYSSLSYLQQLPVEELKIDRSFVAALAQETSAVIVRSTIDLGRNLGLRVVAEGVEDAEIMARLRELQCPIAQGFAISPPLPSPAFLEWVVRHDGGHGGSPMLVA